MSGEITSPGWDAIDKELKRLYPDQEPKHFAPVLPYALGGPDPLQGISVYQRKNPDHWHLVTYGFTDLYDKSVPESVVSGYGFELTIRVSRSSETGGPPHWAVNLLQNLARYVFQTGNAFGVGHHMPTNGPIAESVDTQLQALAFCADPELGRFTSQNGQAEFLQVVGLTLDELALVREWDTDAFLREIARRDKLLITNLNRTSLTGDPDFGPRLRALAAQEGSSMGFSYCKDDRFVPGRPLTWEVGALYVDSLLRGLKGRTLYGREYRLLGEKEQSVLLKPSNRDRVRLTGQVLEWEVTNSLAREIVETLKARQGDYAWSALPDFRIRVVQTPIKDQDGRVIEVVG